MNRFLALTTLACLAFIQGCASTGAQSQAEQIKIPAFSTSGKLQIYWVNEIAADTGSLYQQSRWDSIVQLIIGKESIMFHRPHTVHVDYKGRIFVSDPEAHQVHMFDGKNREHRIIRAETRGDLISPIGLASDEEDHLYISDSVSGRIYRYHLSEKRLERLTAELRRPTGVAFDPYLKQLYVVDTNAHQVVVLGSYGQELYRIGSRGEQNGQFNYPTDICIDKFGRIIVNDTLNSRIQVLFPNGKFILAFGALGNSPGSFIRAKGISTDSYGAIYVSDALTDMIQIFDFKGKHLASFGGSGSAPGEFWMPVGLFIDPEDRLYVADAYNNRIQMFEGLSFDK